MIADVPADQDREVEVALTVRDESPNEVLERISVLRTLAGRALAPLPDQDLDDTYLDHRGARPR